jgi:hypothetical protein
MLSKRFRIVGTSKMRFSPCAVCSYLRQNSDLEQIFAKSPQQTATGETHGTKTLLSDTRNPKPYNQEQQLQRFHEGIFVGRPPRTQPRPAAPPRALRFPGSPVPSKRNGIQMTKREFCWVFKNK